jgi:hypothetical protein
MTKMWVDVHGYCSKIVFNAHTGSSGQMWSLDDFVSVDFDSVALPDVAAEIARSLDLLATKLRGVPPCHRSIRAVFDTIWQRLDAVLVRPPKAL